MSPSAANNERVEYEYVYHWDRIIGVALAVLLLVGGLIWGLSGDEGDAAEQPTVTATEKPQPAKPPVVERTEPAKPAPVATTAPVEATTPVPRPSSNDMSQPVAAKPMPSTRISVTQPRLLHVIDQESLPMRDATIYVGRSKAVNAVFTATATPPGTPVRFVWFHENREVARVNTRITPEGTVTGTKYVSFDAPGQWRVELRTTSDEKVTEAQFTARRK